MSEPTSEALRQAAASAERLIAFYPTIQANDPKVYAAGLVQLFLHYPEHLVAEAIDPVHGIPGECDFPPSIAKVKGFLEPRRLAWQETQDRIARANRKRIEPPPRDLEAEERIKDGFQKLKVQLKA